MNQREVLKKKIEEERKKLNDMITAGSKVGEIYCQSLAVDQLIEQYMDAE